MRITLYGVAEIPTKGLVFSGLYSKKLRDTLTRVALHYRVVCDRTQRVMFQPCHPLQHRQAI